MPSTSTAPAAWHGEELIPEPSGKPRLDDLAQVAGNERDDPYAIGGHHSMHGTGYRTAYKGVYTESCETKRLLGRHFIRKRLPCLPHDASRFGFHEKDLPGHVEDRRDSIVPGCESGFHGLAPVCGFFKLP
jgi:hypothetical protein